jgi:hypothetical protein
MPRVPRVEPRPRLRCNRHDLSTSRAAFLEEALFPEPTARTPLFNAYTQGSYSVTKLDVVKGLQDHALACDVRLRAVLVVGPVGMLWAFHVASLVREGDGVRVNSLVMPHARITGKGTGRITDMEASTLLHDLVVAPSIYAGIPLMATDTSNPEAEFSYRLLLAVFDDTLPRYFHADINDFAPDANTDDLMARLNKVLASASTPTYRVGDKVPPP